MNLSKFFALFIGLFLALSCEPSSHFKDLKEFKNSLWTIKDVQVFNFSIDDPSKNYELKVLVRNNSNYSYQNLFLNLELADSTNTAIQKTMEEVQLFEKISGKPLGSGLGDLFDHKVISSTFKSYTFKNKGNYSLKIGHNMRPDPLMGVMSIGLEVNKLP